jgi:hypothetical protein
MLISCVSSNHIIHNQYGADIFDLQKCIKLFLLFFYQNFITIAAENLYTQRYRILEICIKFIHGIVLEMIQFNLQQNFLHISELFYYFSIDKTTKYKILTCLHLNMNIYNLIFFYSNICSLLLELLFSFILI